MSLDKIKKEFFAELELANSVEEIEKLRVKFLGRKQGLLTDLFKEIPKLSLAEKRKLVPDLNKLKKEVEEALLQKESSPAAKVQKNKTSPISTFDPSLPGEKPKTGHSHPALLVIEEIKEIFKYLGFSWVDGPEVETDEYNFQKLRLHPDHPARDTQQTYYVGKNLLRTHTSSMQARYLERHKPPVRVLFPGRVYRREAIDATHLPGFLQLEGLLVDQNAKMTDLIGVLDFFARRLFGEETKIRVYGHHFPYTEPSIEVEVLYKGNKWLEILGAGMVHPEVIKNTGHDPKKYRGWAFGMGPERIAMLKYGIEDIRLFYSSDLRFLKQF
ncbi:MAG: phenylalanine--tRNA ligase subunit alpha [bacterium]|nr:phenylalanine--tRNA ligase subunit alpha [bacterium]